MNKKGAIPKSKSAHPGKNQPRKTVKYNLSPAQELITKSARQAKIRRSSTSKKLKSVPKKNLLSPQTPVIDLSSECNSSVDSIHCSNITEEVKKQVLRSLALFKNATNDFLVHNKNIEEEVNTFEFEFNSVKKEVDELYWETSRSTQDMLNFKKKMLETPEKIDGVSEKPSPGFDFSGGKYESRSYCNSPSEALSNLHEEVSNLRKMIEQNEAEFKEAETENGELKGLACKIQESLAVSIELDQHSNIATCKSCCIY